ncbi:MAG: hypothetical protein ABIR00_07425 [Nitrosospira sp.]
MDELDYWNCDKNIKAKVFIFPFLMSTVCSVTHVASRSTYTFAPPTSRQQLYIRSEARAFDQPMFKEHLAQYQAQFMPDNFLFKTKVISALI